MNEDAWNAALEMLRSEQERLLVEMRRIDQRIGELAMLRTSDASSAAAQFVPPPPAPSSLPPPLPPHSPLSATPAPSVPPAAPPPLPQAPSPVAGLAAEPAKTIFKPTSPPPQGAPPPPTPVKPAESLEMRVGSYWLVRIGVAILLTGLVFLATYLYQTITPRLGPAGKTGLLYLASGALLGLGAWLSRWAKEPRMQNFASVVEAGGLAAVFFTTYAAHYLPGLRIISIALCGGWAAAGMVGVHHLASRAGANRRRSRREPLR